MGFFLVAARGLGVNMPPLGTGEVHLFAFLFLLISVVMTGVCVGVFFSMVDGQSNRSYRPSLLEGHGLEWGWTMGPIFIVLSVAIPTLLSLFVWGGGGPVVSVMAVGHQWYWEFVLGGGELQSDSYTDLEGEAGARLFSSDAHLVVPFGVPVRFLAASADVIHNFNVKSLGVSLDAVPGRVHSCIISLLGPGLYSGLCSEVCGPGHFSMALSVEGISWGAYSEFLSA